MIPAPLRAPPTGIADARYKARLDAFVFGERTRPPWPAEALRRRAACNCDIGSGSWCTCLAPKARFIRSLRQRRRKRMSKGEALKAPIKTCFETTLSQMPLRKRKADSRFQR